MAKEDEKAKSASTEAKVEEESKGADKQAKATSQDEKNNQKDSAKDSKQTTLDPAEIEKLRRNVMSFPTSISARKLKL